MVYAEIIAVSYRKLNSRTPGVHYKVIHTYTGMYDFSVDTSRWTVR